MENIFPFMCYLLDSGSSLLFSFLHGHFTQCTEEHEMVISNKAFFTLVFKKEVESQTL